MQGSEAGGRESGGRGQRPEVDLRRLPHELQVHQVELEMQNAELQKAREDLELALENCTDLYDFAPVGYFSLDPQGAIMEVNLTGANMLGLERSRLVRQRLTQFMVPKGRAGFSRFLEQVFAGTEKQAYEAALLNGKGETFWADIQAVRAVSQRRARSWCRVTVSDITTRKQAEEAQRQAAALTITNRELQREIVRREKVEKALLKSELRQRNLLKRSLKMQQELRDLSHKFLQAEEEERKRISRDLHDEITQILVSISIHLENLNREAKVDPKHLKKNIKQTQRLVEKSVNTVHRFARELRPPVLDHLGLTSALNSFLKAFGERTGIHVRLTTFAGVDQLNSTLRTVLYRVVQSALTNVDQHAHASRVEVNIKSLGKSVDMTIRDDGDSFKVTRSLNAGKNRRLGLLGMRERLEMVGGSFKVTSKPGLGTTVHAIIPSSQAEGISLKKPVQKPF